MSVAKITQNTTYLTASIIVQKLFAVVYFIFIARYFVNANVGEYTHAIYLATIFGIFVELGLSNVLTREIAKTPSDAQKFISNVVAIKLLATVITYACLAIFVNVFDYSDVARQLTYLAGLVMVIDSFNVSFYAILRGYQKFFYEALGVLLGQILLVSFGIIAMLKGYSIHFLVLAIVLSSVFHCVYSILILRKKFQISVFPHVSKETLLLLFKIGLPFLIFGVVMRFYGYIDTVLLYKMKESIDVSYYAAAYKITFALTFIPSAFGSALYPAFSEYFVSDKEKIRHVFEKSTYYLMAISLPLSLGTMLLADQIILFIFGANYLPSVLTLRILMLALVFIFLGF